MAKFMREFSVSQADMGRLKELAKEKSIEWDEAQYTEDSEYLRLAIKAYVGRTVFNNNGFTSVMLSMDKQVKKALTLFPEAMKIARVR